MKQEKISTIFFGTHNFAREILQALIDDDKIEVSLVITKPDRKLAENNKNKKHL